MRVCQREFQAPGFEVMPACCPWIFYPSGLGRRELVARV